MFELVWRPSDIPMSGGFYFRYKSTWAFYKTYESAYQAMNAILHDRFDIVDHNTGHVSRYLK